MLPEKVYFASHRAVKAQGEGKVGGYLVAFGLPRDAQGEYFDGNTAFHLDWYNERPVLFHHGLDARAGAKRIGVITRLEKTPEGLWAEAQLDMNDPLARRVYEMVKENRLGWSSGSLPHLVKVASDGRILQWPIIEASLTPTPAEPTRTTVQALKAQTQQLLSTLGFKLEELNMDTQAPDVAVPQSAVQQGAAPEAAFLSAIQQSAALQSAGARSALDSLAADIQSTFAVKANKVDLLTEPEAEEVLPANLDVETTLASVLAVLESAGAVEVPDEAAPDEALEQLPMDGSLAAATSDATNTDVEEEMKEALKRLAQYVRGLQQRYDRAVQRLDLQEAALQAAGKTADVVRIGQLRQTLQDNFKRALNDVHVRALQMRVKFLTAQQKNQQKKQRAAPPPPPRPTPQNRAFSTSAASAPALVTRSRFSNLSPQAMSFAAFVLRSVNPRWQMSDAFAREFGAKAHEAYKAGSLPLEDSEVAIVQALHSGRKSISHTGASGFGQEFVEETWRQEFWRKPRYENAVAGQLRWIDMPSDPYKLPIEGIDPTVYAVPETTTQAQLTYTSGNATPVSRVGSANTTLRTGKLKLFVPFSRELQEDSVADFADLLLDQARSALEEARDFVLLSADDRTGTNNINNFGVAPSPTEKYMYGGGDGFVTVALANGRTVDMGGAKPTLSKLRELRMKLGRVQSQRLNDLVYIIDPYTHTAMLEVDELNSFFNNGQMATVMTGQVARIDNIPVIVSNELKESAAAGYVSATPSDNTFGRVVCVYKPDWIAGYRRQIESMLSYDYVMDAWILSMFVRMGLVYRSPESVAVLHNIAYTL